jgi:hypothetical protein
VEKNVHRKDYENHSVYRFILPEPLPQYSSPLLDHRARAPLVSTSQ